MHLPEQSIILELMEMSRWAWCSAPTLYIPCLHHIANCPRIPLPNPSKPRCKIITPYALATSAKLKIQAGLWVPQHPRTGPWTDEMEETAKQPTTPPWAVAQIMSLHSIPARWFVQLFVAAVQLNEGATWLSSELQVIHWAAIATGEENKCSGWRDRKNKSVPSQKNAAGKSYIAEQMEASIKTTYFSLTPVLYWFLGIHPVFPHYKFPTRPALGKLESFLLGLSIISSYFLFSPSQPQEQRDLMMLNHTLSRSDFL